jgi:hypothetical protein
MNRIKDLFWFCDVPPKALEYIRDFILDITRREKKLYFGSNVEFYGSDIEVEDLNLYVAGLAARAATVSRYNGNEKCILERMIKDLLKNDTAITKDELKTLIVLIRDIDKNDLRRNGVVYPVLERISS